MGSKKFLWSSISALLFNTTIQAQELSSLQTAPYLLNPIGARALAMCGMQVACANDQSAILSNPALSGYIFDSTIVGGGITALSFGRSITNIGAIIPMSDGFSIGIGLVGNNAGTITRRTNNGISLGTSTLWQGGLVSSVSYLITDYTSIGLAGRMHISSTPDPASNGLGASIDIGIVSSLFDRATIGIAIQNLGFMAFGTEQFSLPWHLRLGACSIIPFSKEATITSSLTLGTLDTVYVPSHEYLLLGIETQYRANTSTPSFVVAAELVPIRWIAVRGGITLYGESSGRPLLFPGTMGGGGIGIMLPFDVPLRIDYSANIGFTANLIHTISIMAQP